MTGALTRSRVAGSVAFGAQGFVLVTILASLPDVKDRYGIGDDKITAAVLGVLVAAAIGTGVADYLSRRSGSRVALATGLAGIGVTVALVALAPTYALAVPAFALYGLALGMVDAGTNMQAVAIQRAYGRPLISSFYASWSVGAIIATLVCSATVGRWSVDPVMLVFLPGLPVGLVAAALVRRDGLRVHDAVDPADTDHVRIVGTTPVPWRAISLLGVALVAFYVADNAAQTWGSLYVRDTLGAADWLGPLALGAYLATTLGSRLFGDGAVHRWGRVLVVRVAGSVAAVGILLVVVAPGAPVAIVGFAVTGAGLGLVAPLAFAAAGELAPDHADAVVARLNVFNYVGTLLGAVLVGAIGSTSTFRYAFLVPLGVVLLIVALSGRFDSPEHEAARRAAARTLPPHPQQDPHPQQGPHPRPNPHDAGTPTSGGTSHDAR
ncbi:MFS transporter [Cellulomonas palmilytica]|uniref:MFS transporter n=1 Tax=Cellulomonas palmilytica TaxID=2608402 RepID=UPI001F2235D9|nr:MFS transporter [Cellulomonas palmilytica]UJP40940.1 MFS transporter [Cellulomonas palmilytica]